MEQLYAEAGCKPVKTAVDYVKTAGVVFAGIVCAALILLTGNFILGGLGIVGIVAIIYFYPLLNVEYEYIFCDGQLDFDKIMGGNKRKTALKIDMEDIEIIGPVKAAELASYKSLKTHDFSSKKADANTYAAVGSVKNENVRILFDPSQKMIECMRMKSPRKVLKSF